MYGTVQSVSPIGECMVEKENRTRVKIIPDNNNDSDFGISIEFLPTPEIAISGGEIFVDWSWAPKTLDVKSKEGHSLVFERSANPFRITIPKRTEGYDPRTIIIDACWDAELKNKLLSLDRENFSFDVLSEVSDSEILPILFDYGRGMRKGGTPTIISNAINVNSQLYSPIAILEDRSNESYRRYSDGSIHVDKIGPYSFKDINQETSVSDPLLNLSRMDVETWEGVYRADDGLLHSSIIIDGIEYSGPSFHACFFELLSLIGSSIENDEDANQEAIVKIVEEAIGLMDKDGLWKYQYPLEISGELVEKGWISSLSQALGAMGLIRAGEHLGDTSLKKYAEKAMKFVMDDGPLVHPFNGWKIFRHHSGNNSACVLSSHLYTVMAISDLTEVMGTKKWKEILDKSILDMASIAPLYDTGYSSYYDLSHVLDGMPSKLSNPQYHCTHTMQMSWLSNKIDSSRISELAKIWRSYIFDSE